MATETSVLSPNTTAATSTVISVPAGESYVIGIYAATSNSLPADVAFQIWVETPGARQPDERLSNSKRTQLVSGPADYYVERPAYTGTPFGVYYSAS